MKMYLISLAVGVLVGVIYSLLHVRSPAPPFVALIGLLGILAGEQILPAAKLWLEVKSPRMETQTSITSHPSPLKIEKAAA
jgi:XapX domain-containing protein